MPPSQCDLVPGGSPKPPFSLSKTFTPLMYRITLPLPLRPYLNSRRNLFALLVD